jgi:hypothetical protein
LADVELGFARKPISEYDGSTRQKVFCYDSFSAAATNHTMFQQAFKNIDDVLWKEAGCCPPQKFRKPRFWRANLWKTPSCSTHSTRGKLPTPCKRPNLCFVSILYSSP